MASQKPIQYRAVHTKTRWRRASHETLENALYGKRGARALFTHTNTAIDYDKHGKPLYVVVWDTRTGRADIVRPDPAQPDGLRHAPASLDKVREYEDSPPSLVELESYFKTEIERSNGLPASKHAEVSSAELKNGSLAAVELDLQARVEASRAIGSTARQMRLRASGWEPQKLEVTTTVFVRNADVIAEVLERARGRCEACGNPAPFVRASNGTPYLEVHHVVPLFQGGADIVSNALALCPNCHRKEHFGTLD